jgi:hypothetical protein
MPNDRKSNYGDGRFVKSFDRVDTVGELVEVLTQLPVDLPLRQGFNDGGQITWFNVGQESECLEIDEADDPDDEDEYDDDEDDYDDDDYDDDDDFDDDDDE